MASESSSAVLELNDADLTEYTDPPSGTEDINDADIVPLIMERGYDIAVKVDNPVKQLSTLETFVTYRVRCVCARWPAPSSVRRRYNHFRVLHKRLSAAHPLVASPPLPPLHSARQQLDRYSPAFVAVRSLALDAFLDRVAKHPILTHSDDFRIFLTTPDEELDKVFKSENSALNLWGLSTALSGGAEKSVNGARVRDPEFTSGAEYLCSLQHKLSRLCALTVRLHKNSTGLATELMGMKRVCDAWALPLLAAYAAAHVDKIRQRDALHATYVSSNNPTGELHNRLEQASEALRSELSDWIPKTRSEIKGILLDIAEKQLNAQTQSLMGWEHALKLTSEANVDELFKTVSKSAVQNLSPSKCIATPTETERDFADLDSNDSSVSKDFELCKDEADLDLTRSDFEDVSEPVKGGAVGSGESRVEGDPLKEFADVDLSS